MKTPFTRPLSRMILTGLLSVLAAGAASADILVGNTTSGIISRYRNDGSLVKKDFITGAGNVGYMHLTATHLYVTDVAGNRVNQYNLDGTAAKVPFINSGLSFPVGVTSDTTGLYVSNLFSGVVGKYNLQTGAAINASLINTGDDAQGILASSGFVFVASPSGDFVKRFNAGTGGLSATLNVSSGRPLTVFRDASDNLLVPREAVSSVGSYRFTDFNVNSNNFISTSVSGPTDITMVGGNIAVMNAGEDRVSLYSPSGALLNANFITVDDSSFSLAVLQANTPYPKPTVTVSGKKTLTTKKAEVTLKGTSKNSSSVELKINGKKPVKLTKVAPWSQKVKLRAGKNTIVITSRGKGGASKSITVVITRKVVKKSVVTGR